MQESYHNAKLEESELHHPIYNREKSSDKITGDGFSHGEQNWQGDKDFTEPYAVF